jgi:hypothetical protein
MITVKERATVLFTEGMKATPFPVLKNEQNDNKASLIKARKESPHTSR